MGRVVVVQCHLLPYLSNFDPKKISTVCLIPEFEEWLSPRPLPPPPPYFSAFAPFTSWTTCSTIDYRERERERAIDRSGLVENTTHPTAAAMCHTTDDLARTGDGRTDA